MGKARKERRLKAAQANARTATQPSRLLALPTELRVQIIEYYVNDIEEPEVHILADGSPRVIALAQANRQLHHEVMPLWRVQHLQDLHGPKPKKIKCLVNNFDFSAIFNIMKQLPHHAQYTIARGELLRIYLAADEDFNSNLICNLRPWLEVWADEDVLRLPVYRFTKPLIRLSVFGAVDEEVCRMSHRRGYSKDIQWPLIRISYRDALAKLHKSQSAGSFNWNLDQKYISISPSVEEALADRRALLVWMVTCIVWDGHEDRNLAMRAAITTASKSAI
ncbi:hypothetical protein LTS10_005047 [Elasticomyces elasticus]|nr:hypothetical protein LTS10_005047 [Elasticomyces elasticus]